MSKLASPSDIGCTTPFTPKPQHHLANVTLSWAATPIRGQVVTDNTLREVANSIARLDPPVTVNQRRVAVSESVDVLILETVDRSVAPYCFNGRPFQRVGTTTSLMPQAEYERRLLERGHSQRRWENQVAEGYLLDDLDVDGIRRTIREAVDAGRLDSTLTGPTETLEKFHLVKGNSVVQAEDMDVVRDGG